MATLEAVAPRVLEFLPATHTYVVDGREIPSVTQLLDDAGLTPDYSTIPPAVLQHARQRGIHVDQCVELLDANDLDWKTVHPEAVPFLEGWIRFKEYEGFTPVASQVPLFHPRHGYAGTLDSVGVLPGGHPVIIERKTTAKMSSTVSLQIAGYAIDGMWFAPPGGGVLSPVPWGPSARLGVQLCRDGTYRLFEYTDPEDFAAFLGVVALAKWRGARRALQPIRRAR